MASLYMINNSVNTLTPPSSLPLLPYLRYCHYIAIAIPPPQAVNSTQLLHKQTWKMNNQRLSIGMTPKTLRLPKPGEMLLSVHGSPLGVYKEDNMETIHESEDG
ncbi:unnamed protein product [Fraxinus pennsylvanica]|uniref:Borealin C-terminal domain-containing protein n=1 Tax=Fraxinus pennsylvanica TaxID=56036 RepID=A0AAD1YZM1_9LAMI|nr:unnamed protein product [Fraxinus pennsylvanica]